MPSSRSIPNALKSSALSASVLVIGLFCFGPKDVFFNIPSLESFRFPRLGIASWYSDKDPGVNLLTSSGEPFDDTKLTCATWDYPFDTLLKVTNLLNQKSILCRVNDRGPARRLNRKIDLSREAFDRIADLEQGLIPIAVTPLRYSSGS